MSASGMLANQAAQEAVAQNLANASTTGFKHDVPRFQSFGDALINQMSNGKSQTIGSLGFGAGAPTLDTDFSDGALQKTGNPLDVALTGNAYLSVQTPQGVRYTRDGAMTRDAQGKLILVNGRLPVLGTDGKPIQISAMAKDITIDANGVIAADGKRAGQLQLVGLSRANAPQKVGDNLFNASNVNTLSAGSSVQQGFLEASNVNVVEEMVTMISVMRAYETSEKMLQMQDDALGKATTEVSKL